MGPFFFGLEFRGSGLQVIVSRKRLAMLNHALPLCANDNDEQMVNFYLVVYMSRCHGDGGNLFLRNAGDFGNHDIVESLGDHTADEFLSTMREPLLQSLFNSLSHSLLNPLLNSLFDSLLDPFLPTLLKVLCP